MRNCFALSLEVLARRAAGFRNLVVAIVAIGLLSPAAALILQEWFPLLGLLAWLPACGVFVARDAMLVAEWRGKMLGEWVAGNLDLDSVAAMFAANRTFPTGTLAAMFHPLPTRKRLGEESRPSPEVRQVIARSILAIERHSIRKSWFGTVRLLLLCIVTAALILVHSVQWLAIVPIWWFFRKVSD